MASTGRRTRGGCRKDLAKFRAAAWWMLLLLLSLVVAQLASGVEVNPAMDDDDDDDGGDHIHEGGDAAAPSAAEGSADGSGRGLSSSSGFGTQESGEWDEFGEFDDVRDDDLDPGTWRRTLEHEHEQEKEQIESEADGDDAQYARGVRKLVDAMASGDPLVLKESIQCLQGAAERGHPHAQSTLGFLHGSGFGMDKDDAKAFLYHHFAAEGGNSQSKMALAYTYFRQLLFDKAVKLYAELAATAMASFMNSKDGPILDPVRLNDGSEESKEFKKYRGENDDDFQFLEYKAHKGYSVAMYKLGLLYYLGLRGVPRDHAKALQWFIRAVERGEVKSMELLGEIYARGYGVQQNYTKAYAWFHEATLQGQHSAYNGLGWLYARGFGVDKKNLTKAKEYFTKAAAKDDPNGHYNLGILHLKGSGLKRDVKTAGQHFVTAMKKSDLRHPKAIYQLAKMRHEGIGMKQDEHLAVVFYKVVAERGPWGSLLKWALESYINRDIGKALLLYSRAAEQGYEIAQSNAAWILDKYYGEAVCIGKSGVCSDAERHHRAHELWRHAAEQGNQHAALLVGDAYYYGRGTKKDLERAAGAYERSYSNAQAMFNLGYMHEHGLGLPKDLHLAKRYYDQALERDHDAALPVTLALMGLWLRQHYSNSFMVRAIDSAPDAIAESTKWMRDVLADDGNVTLGTLVTCLLTVLYIRQRQRRIPAAAQAPAQEPVPVQVPHQ